MSSNRGTASYLILHNMMYCFIFITFNFSEFMINDLRENSNTICGKKLLAFFQWLQKIRFKDHTLITVHASTCTRLLRFDFSQSKDKLVIKQSLFRRVLGILNPLNLLNMGYHSQTRQNFRVKPTSSIGYIVHKTKRGTNYLLGSRWFQKCKTMHSTGQMDF